MSHFPPNVAVVGCGTWGSRLAATFARCNALRWMCDADRTRLEGRPTDGVGVTDQLDDVLQDDGVAAVVIATPTQTHARIAFEALQHGKDLWVEKPCALSVSETAAIAALARANERICLVDHIVEYEPWRSRLDTFSAARIACTRRRERPSSAPGGALWNLAVHDVGWIVARFGLPDRVQGYGTPEVGWAMLAYDGGLVATVTWEAGSQTRETTVRVQGGGDVCVDADAENAKTVVEPLLNAVTHFLVCLETRNDPRTDATYALYTALVLERIAAQLDEAPAAVGYTAHPTATIDPGAQIGKGTTIWHYTHVREGARIGESCMLGQGVYVDTGAVIGDNCRIQNGVSIYAGVTLEDLIFVGPNATFTNVKHPMPGVPRNREAFEETRIKSGAVIGANATIVCGVTIGAFALVGAGAVVTHDVPDDAWVVGNPAREVGYAKKIEGTVEAGARYARSPQGRALNGDTGQRVGKKEGGDAPGDRVLQSEEAGGEAP